MKALVLSAGYGERLRPLTDHVPKPLVEIGGRPLIHYALLMLRESGIRQIAVNAHHLAAKLQNALGDGRALGVEITYSPEPVLRGTGGPLLALRDFFGAEPFIVVNCDTIMDLEVRAMAAAHQSRRALVTLALRHGQDPDAYSRIETDSSGRVRRMRLLRGRARGEFDDYPPTLPAESRLTPLMYCGAMLSEPAALEGVSAQLPLELMRGLIAPLVVRGAAVFAHQHQGFFRTVDDLESYRQLRAEFTSSPPPLGFLKP